jgi:hypothetical protein
MAYGFVRFEAPRGGAILVREGEVVAILPSDTDGTCILALRGNDSRLWVKADMAEACRKLAIDVTDQAV